MNQETIALVFMDNDMDNFFIKNPPKGPIETWIGAFANVRVRPPGRKESL